MWNGSLIDHSGLDISHVLCELRQQGRQGPALRDAFLGQAPSVLPVLLLSHCDKMQKLALKFAQKPESCFSSPGTSFKLQPKLISVHSI